MLLAADFTTHLYSELIAAIDRTDNDILDDAIAAAEAEAIGYLSRYDTDVLFEAVGAARDPALVMFLKDMAAWHFINLSNADIDLALRKERYEDALDWLKGIQSSKIVPKGWPLPVEENAGDNNVIKVSSAPKRNTRY